MSRKRKEEVGFVVVGVRHFINGEHHWLVPNVLTEYEWDNARGFAEEGTVRQTYHKPVFTSMKDAERFAMAFIHAPHTLGQWEERRPTMYIIEEAQYIALVNKDEYAWPEEAEGWSDEKAADFERECDCEDIKNLAVWDSETDEERVDEKVLKMIDLINRTMRNTTAWLEDGLVAVHYEGRQNKECCADFIESRKGFPKDSLEWEKSDEPNGVAYYSVK